MNKLNLYDWVFRFNPYDDRWYATKRDNYPELFGHIKSDDVLMSKNISDLVYIIKKTNGDKSKIKRLLK